MGVKTGDKAAKGNSVMNRQHSQGVRFRRSGMGRQGSGLRWIAAAEAVTRAKAKEIADEAAQRLNTWLLFIMLGGVVNVSGAAVNSQENILFLAGTWRFRLDPH
jgi:hypothetical protein